MVNSYFLLSQKVKNCQEARGPFYLFSREDFFHLEHDTLLPMYYLTLKRGHTSIRDSTVWISANSDFLKWTCFFKPERNVRWRLVGWGGGWPDSILLSLTRQTSIVGRLIKYRYCGILSENLIPFQVFGNFDWPLILTLKS